MGALILVLGGARSGKSAFAEHQAERRLGRVYYVATSEPCDDEMRERIAVHRNRRPPEWQTIESPLDPVASLEIAAGPGDTVLLDSISAWISNMLIAALGDCDDASRHAALNLADETSLAVRGLLAWQHESGCELILVSDEVGLSLVPRSASGRIYRDLLGDANQLLAAAATSVFLLVAGIPVRIKGGSESPRDVAPTGSR